MLVMKEPEFDAYCKVTYVIDDAVGSNVADEGYFSEDDLPVDEMDEVPDEWLNSHLMDDTVTVTSTVSPTSKYMVEEVDHYFVVDDYAGQVDKDFIEAPAELSGYILHESVMTGLCKPTKSSGDEPLFNC
jgi:hypothetical protein